jgi:hypothetical protein
MSNVEAQVTTTITERPRLPLDYGDFKRAVFGKKASRVTRVDKYGKPLDGYPLYLAEANGRHLCYAVMSVCELPLAPSWVFEIDRGYFEYGYLLKTPISLVEFESLSESHIFRAYTTTSLRDGGMLEWHPERRYSYDEVYYAVWEYIRRIDFL